MQQYQNNTLREEIEGKNKKASLVFSTIATPHQEAL